MMRVIAGKCLMQTSLAFCVESSNGVILSDCIYSCGQIVATRTQHRLLEQLPSCSFQSLERTAELFEHCYAP
jgi:hypothetical protein